jgi:hypothetical protein
MEHDSQTQRKYAQKNMICYSNRMQMKKIVWKVLGIIRGYLKYVYDTQ